MPVEDYCLVGTCKHGNPVAMTMVEVKYPEDHLDTLRDMRRGKLVITTHTFAEWAAEIQSKFGPCEMCATERAGKATK